MKQERNGSEDSGESSVTVLDLDSSETKATTGIWGYGDMRYLERMNTNENVADPSSSSERVYIFSF